MNNTVEIPADERAAIIGKIKGAIRATLTAQNAAIACAAIDLAEAVTRKREVYESIRRMARFGFDDCEDYRFAVRKAATLSLARYGEAVAGSCRGKAVRP